MKRTDALGHSANRFTAGNPSMGIPATVVDETFMNNVQEEICNVVEAADITLSGAVETQLLAALRVIMKRGGAQISQSILDNAGATSVAGVVFLLADIKAAKMFFNIHRRDAGQHADETGEIYCWYDTETATWELAVISHNDDAGVDFTITAGGQLQYASSNYGGGSYSGTLRISQITTIDV
jgi:hypothetical protein